MRRTTRLVFVAALVSSGAGCELISRVDRSQINQGTGGSGEGGAGGMASSSSTGGMAGAGGMAGGGGTGGVAGMGGMGGAGGTGGAGGAGGIGGMGGIGGAGGAGGMGGTGGAGGGPECGPAKPCDDQNPCTDEFCNMATGSCVYTNLDGVPTPGAAQPLGDCKQQSCVNGVDTTINDDADVPDDNKVCTSDTCANGVGSNMPLVQGTPCAPGMPLVCDGMGACVGCVTASDCPGQDTECQTRTCNANVCGVSNTPQGTALSMQTPNDCKTAICNGSGGVATVFEGTDLPGDDGNACTTAACDPALGPVQMPVSVDDGDACTTDTCDPVAGVSHKPVNVDDSSVCTTDACDPVTGVSHTPVSVEDNNACTADACDPVTGVSHTAVSIDDGNACTSDACDSVTGVSHTPVSVDDGNACTSDACDPVSGVSHTPVNADDSNACTMDSCDPVSGVSHTPVSVDDSNVCTADACDPVTGVSHTPVSVDDGDACTVDACDPVAGISHTPVDVDDGNQCTVDTCVGGVATHMNAAPGTPCNQNGGTQCDGMGTCFSPVPPTVTDTTPTNGAAAVASTSIAVTFSSAMNPATLTGQTTAGACTGSIQVSLDNFASCIAFSSASAAMSAGNTVATFTAAPGLLVNRTYQIRVTTAAQNAGGLALASTFTQMNGFGTTSPNLCDGTVVISQVYGGGGGASSTYKNDFIELHNRGATAISLAGWSVQYASATGSTWQVTPLSGSIPPGGFYLVGEAGGAAGLDLPTPDATGSSAMSATAGKVALVNTATALAGACPVGSTIVDIVGYGTTANCFEGAGPTPAPSATASVLRAGNSCGDVGNNAVDFTAPAPSPRNIATAASACACVVENESNAPGEMDYCTTQAPLSLNLAAGSASGTIYGRIYEAAVTPAAGAPANVRAQLGYGPPTANPQYQPFTWINATYNVGFVDPNNDEYQASFTIPAAGAYRYVYRFSLDQGVSWTYCDNNQGDFGAGSNPGLTFDIENEAVLTSF